MQDCVLCDHDRRWEIERAVRAGVDLADICYLFGLAAGEVWRHFSHGSQADDSAPLAERNRTSFQGIRRKASAAAAAATQTGNARLNLAAVQRAQSLIALASAVDRDQAAKADEPEAFTHHPMWLDLKGRILRALEGYPEAYRALLEALDV